MLIYRSPKMIGWESFLGSFVSWHRVWSHTLLLHLWGKCMIANRSRGTLTLDHSLACIWIFMGNRNLAGVSHIDHRIRPGFWLRVYMRLDEKGKSILFFPMGNFSCYKQIMSCRTVPHEEGSNEKHFSSQNEVQWEPGTWGHLDTVANRDWHKGWSFGKGRHRLLHIHRCRFDE